MSDPPFLEPLVQLLKDLIDWLDGIGRPYIIIGGIAASFLARPRTTGDADVLIVLDEKEWKGFLASALKSGFEPRIENPLEFAHLNRMMLLRHKPSLLDVDISFGMLSFEQEAIQHRQVLSVAGLKIPLPRPEDLVVMKALPRRPRDVVDIEALLDAHPVMDLRYVLNQVGEFARALEMPEILEDLKRLVKRKRKRRTGKKSP